MLGCDGLLPIREEHQAEQRREDPMEGRPEALALGRPEETRQEGGKLFL